MDQIDDVLNKMTLEEKAALLSGKDFWRTVPIQRLGIPQLRFSDGPTGLRIPEDESNYADMERSKPATCFPAECLLAASFDPDLVREMGRALGEEAAVEDVSVVLGPGVTIKRNPLCGRNFEYFSEDPFLAGQMGAAYVEGVQSCGVGTSLKHFTCNNQETARMVNNSVVDERTLREIYLAPFERVVQKAQPWTVMSSYNRLNGIYQSDNSDTLTGILRDKWGFHGAVVSDWGGMHERIASLQAGMDLEMPNSGDISPTRIVAAVRSGKVSEDAVDRSVRRILELIAKAEDAEPVRREIRGENHSRISREVNTKVNRDALENMGTPATHHTTARKLAEQSAVLLKNEDHLLPLQAGSRVAVIGAFAAHPRYQGGGSSHVVPTNVDIPLKALRQAGFNVRYAKGYRLENEPGTKSDESLIQEAVQLAKQADYAVVFAGLRPSDEMEGFDRDGLQMPKAQTQLIRRVSEANSNLIVVLMCGAPVDLSWRSCARSILLMYLAGEAVGSAVTDILSGTVSPSGKLPETWPKAMEDVPSVEYFANNILNTEYREAGFTGYRWYDTAGREPSYPFGFGLSYSRFTLSDAAINVYSEEVVHSEKVAHSEEGKTPSRCDVSVSVKNIGICQAAEVVQVYVGKQDSRIPRPVKELKGFHKVWLRPGEEQNVVFSLRKRDFAYYDTVLHGWNIEPGEHQIYIGTSSRDISAVLTMEWKGQKEKWPAAEVLAESVSIQKPEAVYDPESIYFHLPTSGRLQVSEKDYAALFSGPVPRIRPQTLPYSPDSTFGFFYNTKLARAVRSVVRKMAAHQAGTGTGTMDLEKTLAMLDDMPLRAVTMTSILDLEQLEAGIQILNGNRIHGLREFLRLLKKKKSGKRH